MANLLCIRQGTEFAHKFCSILASIRANTRTKTCFLFPSESSMISVRKILANTFFTNMLHECYCANNSPVVVYQNGASNLLRG